MAVAIVATVGGSASNSFVTLAEAETRMEARLNVALWDAATDDTKNRALVEAAQEFQMLPWVGTRVDTTQALPWPREYAPKPDLPDDITVGTSYYYLTTEIPQLVKDAQIELAWEFVRAGTTDVAARDALLDIASERVDVLETEYVPQAQRARGLARYPRVVAFLLPLLDVSGAMAVSRV